MFSSLFRVGFALALLINFCPETHAQADISSGVVRFEMQGGTLEGQTAWLDVSFAPGKALSVLSTTDGTEVLRILSDYDAGKAYMIFREGEQVLATPVTFRDLCITGADKAVPGTSDDATREILGYSCRKKTILINADGRSEIYEAWVTDRIQTPYRILNGLENLLGGFPLEIEMKQSAQTGFYVRYKAVEIRNTVDEKIFKVPE